MRKTLDDEINSESRKTSRDLKNHLKEASYPLPKPYNKVVKGVKESDIQKDICEHLKRKYPHADIWRIEGGAKLAHVRGGLTFLPSTGKGRPDVQVILDGRVYALEIKKPGGRVKASQLNVLQAMQRAGGRVGIVVSVEGADSLMTGWPGEKLLIGGEPCGIEVYG